jgi:hypothetical protein
MIAKEVCSYMFPGSTYGLILKLNLILLYVRMDLHYRVCKSGKDIVHLQVTLPAPSLIINVTNSATPCTTQVAAM